MVLKTAVAELEALAKVGRSAACEALNIEGGRFSNLLIRGPDTNLITIRGYAAHDAEAEESS